MDEFDVFLSYQSETSVDLIRNLEKSLEKENLKICSNNRNQTKSYEELESDIENSKTVICFISKKYINSNDLIGEISYAYSLKKKIVLVYIEKISLNEIKGIGSIINSLTKINLYNYPSVLSGDWSLELLNKLLDCLRAEIYENSNVYQNLSKNNSVTNLPEMNINFIDRSNYFEKINEFFYSKNNNFEIVSICGLPGIGKSTIACEYAHRQSKHDYNLIVWYFQADSQEKLLISYQNLLLSLNIKINILLDDKKKKINSAHDKLVEIGANFLFIVDNVEKKCDVIEFLESIKKTKNDRVKVLVTSTNPFIFEQNQIQLDYFSQKDAREYFNKLKLTTFLKFGSKRKLINLLKNKNHKILPFKLVKACSFLKQNSTISIDLYSELLKKYGSKEVETMVILESIKNKEIQMKLLMFVSFLDPDFIDISIISYLLKISIIELQDHINNLADLSIIDLQFDQNQKNIGIKLHRIVISAIRNYFDKGIDIKNYLDSLFELFLKRIIESNQTNYFLFRDVKIHLEKVLLDKRFEETVLNITDIEDSLGIKLNNLLGNIDNIFLTKNSKLKFVQLMEKKYERVSAVFKENTISAAINLENLGLAYQNLGEITKSVYYLEKSLSIYQSVYSDENIYIANSYNYLGNCYHDLGDLTKALENFEKSLKTKESICSEDHIEIAKSKNNLGLCYIDMGDLRKAVYYLEASVRMKENVYSKDHPNLAHSLNNLATCYLNAGDFKTAFQYLDKSLMKEIIDNEFSFEYKNLSIYNKSVDFIAKGLLMHHKLFSDYYSDDPTFLKNDLNDYDQVQSDFVSSKKVNLYEHENFYKRIKRYKKMIYYTEKGLSMFTNLLFNYQVFLENNLHKIDISSNDLKDYKKSIKYIEKFFPTLRGIPLSDLKLAEWIYASACSYSSFGFDKKAIFYLKDALKLFRNTLSNNPVNYQIAKSLREIGLCFKNLCDFRQSLSYLEKSLKVFQRWDSPDITQISELYFEIGICYQYLAFYKSAISFLEKGLRINKNIYSENHLKVEKFSKQIGLLYEYLG